MHINIIRTVNSIIIGLVAFTACQQPRAPGPSALTPEEAREVWARYGAYFPKDVALGEWTRGANFEYAEGEGAEAFVGEAGTAYGCKEVICVTYAHRFDAGKDITATVADVGEPGAAYGLLTYLRPEGAEPWDGGDVGERGASYIAFAADRYYVRVETAREFFGAGAALDELGVGLAVRFPKAGTVPDLVNLLPGTDLEATSVKYGSGPAILTALRPDLEPYVRRYAEETEAFVIGKYAKDEVRLLIVEWAPEGESESRFARLLKETDAEPTGSVHEGGIRVFKRFRDTRPIMLCLNGNFLVEVFEYNDESYARALLEQATGPLVEISGATIGFL